MVEGDKKLGICYTKHKQNEHLGVCGRRLNGALVIVPIADGKSIS